MNMFSAGWVWVYAGVIVMLLELVAPGFILCFFGLAAVSVGALRLLIGDGFGLAWQLAAFSFLSVAYIVVLRRFFRRSLTGDRLADRDLQGEYVGRTGRVTEAIRPPLAGRVMIGDAEWSAVADRPVESGRDVKVVFQQNITMKVEEL